MPCILAVVIPAVIVTIQVLVGVPVLPLQIAVLLFVPSVQTVVGTVMLPVEVFVEPLVRAVVPIPLAVSAPVIAVVIVPGVPSFVLQLQLRMVIVVPALQTLVIPFMPPIQVIVDVAVSPVISVVVIVVVGARGDAAANQKQRDSAHNDAEPEKWSLQIVDTEPNPEGSPGLFGESLVTPIKSEIYYDNILVSPNK